MAHVVLKDLVKTYGAVYAVRDVSLEVPRGAAGARMADHLPLVVVLEADRPCRRAP